MFSPLLCVYLGHRCPSQGTVNMHHSIQSSVILQVFVMQVMIECFKEAVLCTRQLIEFGSSDIEIKVSSNPDENWIIKTINSHVVS